MHLSTESLAGGSLVHISSYNKRTRTETRYSLLIQEGTPHCVIQLAEGSIMFTGSIQTPEISLPFCHGSLWSFHLPNSPSFPQPPASCYRNTPLSGVPEDKLGEDRDPSATPPPPCPGPLLAMATAAARDGGSRWWRRRRARGRTRGLRPLPPGGTPARSPPQGPGSAAGLPAVPWAPGRAAGRPRCGKAPRGESNPGGTGARPAVGWGGEGGLAAAVWEG